MSPPPPGPNLGEKKNKNRRLAEICNTIDFKSCGMTLVSKIDYKNHVEQLFSKLVPPPPGQGMSPSPVQFSMYHSNLIVCCSKKIFFLFC